MLSLLRRIGDPGNVTGAARSPQWASFSKRYLRGRSCIACGSREGLTAHHVVPFHLRPDLELDEKNLVPLCTDRCHLVWGHLDDYRLDSPTVREDAAEHLAKRRAAQARQTPSA